MTGRVLAVALVLCAMTRVPAQQSGTTQRPTFRATANLIEVDVVVVGPDGLPVRGLTKDDFQILDRGAPADVAAFEEINHERPPQPVLPPTLKLDVADNSTARSDRLVVLVVDDLHFQGKTQAVKDMARRVIEQLGPQASLSLVTTSGEFGVEPTEDRALLLAQLDAFVDKFDPEGKRMVAGARGPREDLLPVMGTGVPNSTPTGGSGPGNLSRFFGDMTQYKTVAEVAKKVGADDGRRKAFVWISGGNGLATQEPTKPPDRPVGVPAAMTADDFGLMGKATILEALRKSNVAAYSIATGDFNSALLEDVADATGGFVIDMGNFDRDLERLIEDLDHYYLLGFYAADAKDRSYHPLEVRVKRPGLAVRYRKGYQAGSTPAPPKNKTDLARMAANVLPNTDLPLRFFASPAPKSAGRDAGVDLTLEVRADRASLVEADGNVHDVLKYEVWAVDLKKKSVTKTVAREARIALGPREVGFGANGVVTYQVHANLPLSPGRYQLRASATSAKVEKGGSVYLEVEMPDFRAREPVLGGIAIGYSTGLARLGGGIIEDASSEGAFKPSLDRAFSRADTVRLVCDVSNPAVVGGQAVVELLDAAGAVVIAIDESAIEAKPVSRIDVTTPLRSLAPGGYLLRITVKTGQTSTEREVGIIVR